MTEEVEPTEEVDATVAHETGEESEPEKTEQETPPETKEEDPEKTFTQSEVEELIGKRAKRIERKLRREFEDKTEKKEPVKVTKVDAKPKLEDYESTEDWVEALADYKVDQRQAISKKEAEEAKQQEETAKVIKSFERKTAKFEETHPDFQDVMDDLKDYEIPGYVMEAVMTADLAPDVAYFLGNNQEELEKILDKSPAAAIRAIGRLEAKLEKSEPEEVSKAPAPLKTLKGKGTSVEDPSYVKGDDFEKFLDTRYIEMGRGKRKR